LFGSLQDITERKRAEEEKAAMEAQNRQLQKAESLGRMAGAIAHHFNNQLQAVMGNLQLAMGDLQGYGDTVMVLHEAMNAAQKAAEVSRLMLTYLGQMPSKRSPLDLSEACRLGLPMIEAAMPKHIVLETDLPTPGPAILANANQVQQVVTNLVANAWESMAEGGGTIHLNVTTTAASDIPATHRFPIGWEPKDGTYACLEVMDCGSGIAEQDVEKLFDPFFSTKFTGRGMGLSVVLGIVRAHGGAITVESGKRMMNDVQGPMSKVQGPMINSEDLCGSAALRETAVGSVFRVFLPLSAEEVARPAEKAVKAPELKGGGVVLVIEDEPQLRQLAERMLALLGFEALTAKDGMEGVEVFREHQDQIRFVLCDLGMPRMDGWATLAALRKLAPGIPVILASGYDEASVMSGNHPEWPQAFLSKPYGIQELREAIRRVVRDHGET
jgi:signal transduction histidine kinase/ActR/RegA family two-component response regulator